MRVVGEPLDDIHPSKDSFNSMENISKSVFVLGSDLFLKGSDYVLRWRGRNKRIMDQPLESGVSILHGLES